MTIMADKVAAECLVVKVPVSHFLHEGRIERINTAKYEGREIEDALKVVREGDVVLEFHPKAYGVEGMQECKAILRGTGFQRIDDVSTRTVWACARPES